MRQNSGAGTADQDSALTRAAQAGDVVALGLLLEEHRAGMRAVALSILGPGPEAEDALQEAALIALRSIATVRNPEAVGAWLRAVVRNRCRDALREARRHVPLDTLAPPPDPGAGPEQLLEHHAMRDWVWAAIEELSPALRLPMVLRYFTEGLTEYQHIAQVCGVPLGTVRSRLSQGRAKLAEALAATAATAHSDARMRAGASWDEAFDMLSAAEAGHFGRVVDTHWSPDASLMSGLTRLGDRALVRDAMDGSLAAGVRQKPVGVAAGSSVVVWEMDMINPADAPDHCPPALAWVMSRKEGRVAELRLYHPLPLDSPFTPDLYAQTWRDVAHPAPVD
ncbi:RNA polymerase sigma factor [Streptacidiphilus fuscans]|uniref:Sigma-70 family RNA polymerase sigma factor n=1 Tax=Streptacidiphilus fuscans TaxID=2789292 RepID=A0A931B0T3_9ACTN|nr:sigma-70 family RNA polymerase sigma factor [Streptacidiphilus fuscans]MBF9068984.1 sigma-70 family RNA polymerase sigma factor [Streptacidiphilus fuscans]MBF9073438.1 sigma-70 family RNA polymerase sigma factor [Streptacidiphilus fuscans]